MFLQAMHGFAVHDITWRALPPEYGNSISRLSRNGVFGAFFQALADLEPDSLPSADVRQHRDAGPRLRGRSRRGQNGQALSRSRGGFTTRIHLKSDVDGQPLAFHPAGSPSHWRPGERQPPIRDPARHRVARRPDRQGLRRGEQQEGGQVTRHLPDHPAPEQRAHQARLLPGNPLQEPRPDRADHGQAHRTTLREDGREPCLHRRLRLRPHLGQIRPHHPVSEADQQQIERLGDDVVLSVERTDSSL